MQNLTRMGDKYQFSLIFFLESYIVTPNHSNIDDPETHFYIAALVRIKDWAKTSSSVNLKNVKIPSKTGDISEWRYRQGPNWCNLIITIDK